MILCCTTAAAWAEEGAAPAEKQQEQETLFPIEAYYFTGNTVFADGRLREVLDAWTGPRRASADVEKARDALEKFYHEEGYPTAVVNIPEQTIGGGVVTLQVIESRIGTVKLDGNRYFSQEKILGELPSLAPGEMLYVPALQKELAEVNVNPDLKVIPSIAPGREVGVVDVQLKAEDKLPLHGSLELNNNASPNTTDLRLSSMLRYDNLWQREHSVTVQYQVSPEDAHEVQVFTGSYSMPLPNAKDQRLTLYGVHSENNTIAKEFGVSGKGDIVGLRYNRPLPGFDGYSHNLTLGVDYKKFDETTLNFVDAPIPVTPDTPGATTTPIRYLPFSVAYGATLADEGGITLLSSALNLSFRGLVAQQNEFQEKRFLARADYVFLTLGVERTQKLPGEFSLYLKLDGQLADQPLINNEQYAAGGMESVRGYLESEEMGDNAVHGVLELATPNLAKRLGLGERYLITPYLFNDFAYLKVKEPLPAQRSSIVLHGVGAGVRGFLFRSLEYQVDTAFALRDNSQTSSGDFRANFKVKYQF